MKAESTAVIHAAPRARRFWRGLALVVVTIGLWIASVDLPGPPVNRLEIWETILIDAHLRDRQFGPEIIFTYGPWAYLSLSGYPPAALPEKWIWEIGGKLLLSVTAVLLSAALPGIRRWLFLAVWIALATFFENSAAVIITLCSLLWLLPPSAAWWQRILAVGWLSFLSHFKFVSCLQAVAGIGIAVVVHAVQRRTRTAVGLLLGFVAAYLSWWMLAGQRLANLPEFWRLSAEISRGYSWAMSLDAGAYPLVLGLVVVLMSGAFGWMIWRSELTRAHRAGAVLLLSANWFVLWKQGYTRADAHVFWFFIFCLLVGLALPAIFKRDRSWGWHDLNAGLCLGGLAVATPWLLTFAPRVTWNRWNDVPRYLTHPTAWREQFNGWLRNDQKPVDDPQLRATIGAGTVDLINYEQAWVLHNGLDYQPRPVVQSYSAYTSALGVANQRFYQSAAAPEFVVAMLNTIDGRYPGQEDALALAEIARRYEVLRTESRYSILHRKRAASAQAPWSRQPIIRHTPHYGDDILVPDGAGHAVWVDIDFRPTLLGRLRAFLYHAPALYLVASFKNKEQKRFRIVPTTSVDGFFIRPFIEGHSQFTSLIRGTDNTGLQTIRLELAQPSDAWFWRRAKVQFSALPELPLRPADQMDGLIDAGVINVRPLRLQSGEASNTLREGGHALLYVHAPSQVVLPVANGEHTLTGGFGFLPGAYTDGRTDGANFSVEAEWADGTLKSVWARTLDPVADAAARGFQPLTLPIPEGVTRLRLNIGSHNNTQWDWTYWGDLRLVP